MTLKQALLPIALLVFTLPVVAQTKTPKVINQAKLKKDINYLLDPKTSVWNLKGKKYPKEKGSFQPDYFGTYRIDGSDSAFIQKFFSTSYTSWMGVYKTQAAAEARYDALKTALEKVLPETFSSKSDDTKYYQILKFYPTLNPTAEDGLVRLMMRIDTPGKYAVMIQVIKPNE